jgi:hypothetical protein
MNAGKRIGVYTSLPLRIFWVTQLNVMGKSLNLLV